MEQKKKLYIGLLVVCLVCFEIFNGFWLSWEVSKVVLYSLGRCELAIGWWAPARWSFQQIAQRQAGEYLGEGYHGRLARFREALPKIRYVDVSTLSSESYYREGVAALSQNDYPTAKMILASIPYYRDVPALLKGQYYRTQVPTNNIHWIVQAGEQAIRSIAFSPDGRLLASTSGDAYVRLWRVQDGKLLRVLYGDNNSPVKAVFTANGRLLSVLCSNGTIKIIDIYSGLTLKTLNVSTSDFDIHPNGQWFVSDDGISASTIVLYNINNGSLIARITDTSPVELKFTPDGTRLVGFSPTEGLTIWDTVDMTIVYENDQRIGGGAIAISPNSLLIAETRLEHHDVVIHLAANGAVLNTISLAGRSFPPRYVSEAAAFSNDSKMLAVVNTDSNIVIWDLVLGKPSMLLPGDATQIDAIVYHPNGHMLATAGQDGTIVLWSI
jgi:WD40 repeat protein